MRAFPILAVLALAACDRTASTPALPGEPASSGAAPFASPPPPPTAVAPVSPSAPATASAAATTSSSAGTEPSASATASASPPPPPAVRVENIGMHIGGGPNDAENKAPITESVAPHFDELRACWARVDDPRRGGDFGVDILIQPEGGRARVSNPRTAIHPAAFRDCVVTVFEAIEFKKNKKGLTMVSYSLRFTPSP